MSTTDTTTPLAAQIEAVLPFGWVVVIHRAGAVIDVRPNPATARNKLADMVRIIADDGTYRVAHLTHNEVLCGEARLSGSLTAMVPSVVANMVEAF